MFEFVDQAPFSSIFQDIYFSPENGLEESRHVFIEGSKLKQRWGAKDSFVIGETGFGTGLNFLATWDCWRKADSRPEILHYISIEKHPLTADQILKSHKLFPDLCDLSLEFIAQYPLQIHGFHRIWFNQHKICLTLCFMDVCAALADLDACVDCWFLDGFSPAKNPEMWSKTVFRHLARLGRVDTSIATFSAAGHVRRGLAEAGFEVGKIPGYGRKREMTTGILTTLPRVRMIESWRSAKTEVHNLETAIVVGAGIAGAQIAHKLALRGFRVKVLEQLSDVALEASGNPRCIVSPRLSGQPSLEEDFSIFGFLSAINQLNSLEMNSAGWSQCGVLSLVTNERKRKQWRSIRKRPLPSDLVQTLEVEAASEIAGVSLTQPALYFPQAGWIEPARVIRALLSHQNIEVSCGYKVEHIKRTGSDWRLQTKCPSGQIDHNSTEVLIIANGRSINELSPTALPVDLIEGQTTFAKSSDASEKLQCVLQHDGYITPSSNGVHLVGATYQKQTDQQKSESISNQVNLSTQKKHLPEFTNTIGSLNTAHCSHRVTTTTRWPLIGAVPNAAFFSATHDTNTDQSAQPFQPGLFILGAFGSRGFSTSALAAEILCSEILGDPSPVRKVSKKAVEPVRWIARIR